MSVRLVLVFVVMLLCYSGNDAGAGSLAGKLRYGHFCGSGHGNSSTKPPIDQLDAGCRAHDLCCKKAVNAGLGVKICPCHCDRAARQMAQRFLGTKKGRSNRKARRAALFIAAFYRTHACFCRKRICVPKLKCRIKRKCTKRLRRRICVRVPRCRLEKKCGMAKTPGRAGRCFPTKCKKKKICKRILRKRRCLTGVVCK